MSLALFDLDNTLIAGDSDYLWGQHLVDLGVVDREDYTRANQRFYADYAAGVLDIYAYTEFAFKPLADNTLDDLYAWRDDFIEQQIRPILLAKAQELLTRHHAQGDTLIIITSTNRFVTEPIAQMLGVKHLLATEPEFTKDGYTGKLSGKPCFREGKIQHLNAWLTSNGGDIVDSWFYSDSINDLPLLQHVAHPVVVDGDERLLKEALTQGWQSISLRQHNESG